MNYTFKNKKRKKISFTLLQMFEGSDGLCSTWLCDFVFAMYLV